MRYFNLLILGSLLVCISCATPQNDKGHEEEVVIAKEKTIVQENENSKEQKEKSDIKIVNNSPRFDVKYESLKHGFISKWHVANIKEALSLIAKNSLGIEVPLSTKHITVRTPGDTEEPVYSLGSGVLLTKAEEALLPEEIRTELGSFKRESKNSNPALTGDSFIIALSEVYPVSFLDKIVESKVLYVVMLDEPTNKYRLDLQAIKDSKVKQYINLPAFGGYYFIFYEDKNAEFKVAKKGAAG